MSGIFDLLQGPMGQMIMQGASSQLGLGRDKTESAMSAAIPMLMGALKRQASNPETASGLFNALKGKHDGSILDSVMDIFGGGNVNKEVVEDGDKISAGDVIARIPREGAKTKDITGGLPRVAELFEVRKPKVPAIITEIDGRVTFGKDLKGKRRVIVVPETGEPREYLIPKAKHITVHEGDYVKAGEPLIDINASNIYLINTISGETKEFPDGNAIAVGREPLICFIEGDNGALVIKRHE